jgi:hypothetical protein
MGDQPAARQLPTHKQEINAHRPSTPRAGDTAHALEGAATVMCVFTKLRIRWVGYVAQMIRKCVKMFNRKTWRAEITHK